MTLNDLTAEIACSYITCIVGPPCAGKTYLTEEVKDSLPNHEIIHTDDYISFGFKESIYKCLYDIAKLRVENPDQCFLIEGIQTARLLRKGIELGTFKADLVIKLDVDIEVLKARYQEREQKQYPLSTMKSINTVYDDYMASIIEMNQQPEFISYPC